MPDPLATLSASVHHLHELVSPLGPDELTESAYPDAWTIADVLSHVGSGAVIFSRRLDDVLKGVETPDDFAQGVWDEWNAKSPVAQAADALAADQSLVDSVNALTPAERESIQVGFGPFTFDFDGFIDLRVNEHVLHTWDVDVALHPGATVPDDAVAAVIDNLELITTFSAKSDGDPRRVVVRTTDPSRTFTIDVTADSVSTGVGDVDTAIDAVDLSLPAEAFVRLVYGRLDVDHTPADVADNGHLDGLRAIYPGP